jgi:hypothetical protein
MAHHLSPYGRGGREHRTQTWTRFRVRWSLSQAPQRAENRSHFLARCASSDGAAGCRKHPPLCGRSDHKRSNNPGKLVRPERLRSHPQPRRRRRRPPPLRGRQRVPPSRRLPRFRSRWMSRLQSRRRHTELKRACTSAAPLLDAGLRPFRELSIACEGSLANVALPVWLPQGQTSGGATLHGQRVGAAPSASAAKVAPVLRTMRRLRQ